VRETVHVSDAKPLNSAMSPLSSSVTVRMPATPSRAMCPHAITVTARTRAFVLFIAATTAHELVFEQIGPTPPGDPRLGLKFVSVRR